MSKGGQNEEAPTAAHTGGLVRKSVQRRQDVDLSVSAQLRVLKDYARANGYSVAREYVAEAESGRIADRPQFRRMIDEAAKPKAPFREILMGRTQQQRKTSVLVGGRFGPIQARSAC